MAEEKSPEEKLYDFFLMGLMWLREDKPEVLSGLGASVFASYSHATKLTRSFQYVVATCFDLMELIQKESEVLEGDKRPERKVVLERITLSEKNSIIIVVPRGEVDPEKLIAPGGYRHVITEKGIEHAKRLMPDYERTINKKLFLKGWRLYKAQMATIHAQDTAASKLQQAPRQGVAEADVSIRRIPPAPNVTPEW